MSNLETYVAQLIAEHPEPEQIEWSTLHDLHKYKVVQAIKADDHRDLDDLGAHVMDDEDFIEAMCRFMFDSSQNLLFNVFDRAITSYEVAAERFNEEVQSQLRDLAA